MMHMCEMKGANRMIFSLAIESYKSFFWKGRVSIKSGFFQDFLKFLTKIHHEHKRIASETKATNISR